jgi:hypothetical protein
MRSTMQASRMPRRGLMIAVALFAVPAVALAYINPGNGAYMVQALFTLAGAGMFYLRHPSRLLQAVRLWWAARREARQTPRVMQADEPEFRPLVDQLSSTDSN